jgi:hypothetical protein
MPNLSQAQIGGNEFFIQISHNLRYLKTYNYDLFSFYPANRAPDHWVRIKESIEKQDLTHAQPILVDSFGHVIDGQGRFTACKALKMPIYALVMLDTNEVNGESYISLLNSYQKNWATGDFLRYYCKKGIKHYIEVAKEVENTGFTVSTILGIWQSGNNTSEAFKTGNYTFGPDAIKRVRFVHSVFKVVMAHKSARVDLTNPKALIKAITSILLAGAKVGDLKTQIFKFSYLIEHCGGQKQYFAMLQHIYNYKKRFKNKVAFTLYNAGQGGALPGKRGKITL